MRSGTRRAPELHQVDVAGLARGPSPRIPGGEVQPEPARGIAIERQLRVRLVEREVRGDADRAFRRVGDGERDARSRRSEQDVALGESHGPGSVIGTRAERRADHDETRAFVEQDFQADLRRDVGHAVEYLVWRDRDTSRLDDVFVRSTPARRGVHPVAGERDPLGPVQLQTSGERPPGELGCREDPEAIFVGGRETHGRRLVRAGQPRSTTESNATSAAYSSSDSSLSHYDAWSN